MFLLLEVDLRRRADEVADAPDVRGALGDRDRAARVEQVERVVRLEDHVVGRQRQLPLDQPDAFLLRIGEVAELCELPTYVLRFWETEFPQLRPTKSSTGQRMYRRRDVDHVLHIRKLLYQDGFTIAGARQQLRVEARAADKSQPVLPFPARQAGELKRVRQGLREVLGILAARH